MGHNKIPHAQTLSESNWHSGLTLFFFQFYYNFYNKLIHFLMGKAQGVLHQEKVVVTHSLLNRKNVYADTQT
jgi:hypothetical protein